MEERRPGPSSTERGSSVFTTGSPIKRPVVSSYTWMTASSPSSRMISPRRASSPTFTTSYIFDPFMPRAMITGPEILNIVPVIMSSPLQNNVVPDSFFQEPLDIRPPVDLFRSRGEGNDERAVHLLDPVHHFLIEGKHVLLVDGHDPDIVL